MTLLVLGSKRMASNSERCAGSTAEQTALVQQAWEGQRAFHYLPNCTPQPQFLFYIFFYPITGLQADKTRVKDYIHRLDNFDGPAVGEIAVG